MTIFSPDGPGEDRETLPAALRGISGKTLIGSNNHSDRQASPGTGFGAPRNIDCGSGSATAAGAFSDQGVRSSPF